MTGSPARSAAPINVLVLCTGNSARSILGEALVTSLGQGRFAGFSAGSHPKGQPHPMALAVLESKGIDPSGFRSKSWSEFSAPGAPEMDVILTVCDDAAGESCPVWLGHPATAHWGLPDPAAVEREGQRAAFEAACDQLHRRVARLVALPDAVLAGEGLGKALQAIHEEEARAD